MDGNRGAGALEMREERVGGGGANVVDPLYPNMGIHILHTVSLFSILYLYTFCSVLTRRICSCIKYSVLF